MIEANSMKKLWSVEGDYESDGSRVVNILYGLSSGETEPDECILWITSLDGTTSGFLFENDEIDGIRISELLHQYIITSSKKGKQLFYQRAITQDKTKLSNLLYSCR
jgi:hypothetical protein